MTQEGGVTGEAGLSPEQGKALLLLARNSIERELGLTQAEEDGECQCLRESPVLAEKRGTFVTLKRNGELRGCIGNLAASESIVEGIVRNAQNAAFHDSRFKPVGVEDWAQISLAISILTPPQTLAYRDADELLARLRPGIDGVVLRKGPLGATFLPQVWEQLPKAEDFLTFLCRKANLPGDAWRTGPLEVQTYQVQYFEE